MLVINNNNDDINNNIIIINIKKRRKKESSEDFHTYSHAENFTRFQQLQTVQLLRQLHIHISACTVYLTRIRSYFQNRSFNHAVFTVLQLCLLRYFPSRNLVDRADNCYTSLYFLFLLFLPSMFLLLIISSGAPRQCRYESSGCVRKKITLYRNFFRNLNFKNIANFFKRTCCHLNHLFIFLYSTVMFSFV